MYRTILVLAVAGLVTLAAPAASDAAVIQCFDPSAAGCKPIGQFAWDQVFDDVFTLFNQSDGPDAPTAGGSFTDVVLSLDDASTDLPDIDAGGQTDTLGLCCFFGTVEAELSFTFMSAPFALTRTTPGSELVYAQTVVPEPSTLLLLGSGALMLRARRRHR